MERIIDMLPADADARMRAYGYDMAIHQELRDGNLEEGVRIARLLMPLWDELIMGTPEGEEQQAAYIRLCFHALLAGEPPRPCELVADEVSWSGVLLQAGMEGARSLASGDEADVRAALAVFDGLREQQQEQEGPWLVSRGSTRGSVQYIVGLYHAVSGIRRMCQLALGEEVELDDKEPDLTPAQLIERHFNHVDELDAMMGGPTALTQMPRPQTITTLMEQA